jgi:hypothetical protein
MADVVVKRDTAAWLADVAKSVPEAHLDAFFAQLGAVAKELVGRLHSELAGEVIDLLVTLRGQR